MCGRAKQFICAFSQLAKASSQAVPHAIDGLCVRIDQMLYP